ncbi:SAM-dependent methyltransferase [Streptomyces californicus]|uniref:SAM-dependent methyltransferase n=1 Tax=Streptomyces californicus TaxID=67351 RepID=UPI003722520F
MEPQQKPPLPRGNVIPLAGTGGVAAALGAVAGGDPLGQDRAHTARVHNYLLNGWNHYAVDRACGDAVQAVFPGARLVALSGSLYADRVIRYLAAQGVRQFVAVGVGLPVEPYLHTTAQSAASGTSVLYLDTDWLSLAYGDVLTGSHGGGVVACAEADALDPQALLAVVERHGSIDLGRPVGLLLHALLDLIPDERDPHAVVERLTRGLPPGSCLSLTHSAADLAPDAWAAATKAYRAHGIGIHPRPRDEVARFFDGLEPVAPGLTPAHRWRPDNRRPPGPVTDRRAPLYAGVARIP